MRPTLNFTRPPTRPAVVRGSVRANRRTSSTVTILPSTIPYDFLNFGKAPQGRGSHGKWFSAGGRGAHAPEGCDRPCPGSLPVDHPHGSCDRDRFLHHLRGNICRW